MIKKVKKVIKKITSKEADNRLVKGKLDKDKKEFEFNENVKTGIGFLFAHDGEKVIGIREHTDEKKQTTSIHEIVECDSEQDCLDRITELGLIYNAPEEVLLNE